MQLSSIWYILVPFLFPFPLTVAEESAKLVGVDVVMESEKKLFIELEGRRELYHDLPHTLKELCEDG